MTLKRGRSKAGMAGFLGLCAVFSALAFAAVPGGAPAAGDVTPAPGAPASDTHPAQWDLLAHNCTKCHNATDWAGGVAFDVLTPQDVPHDAAVWEKAITKLQGRLMPPPGNPQPTQASIDDFTSWLQHQLDAAAAANPQPGNVGLHRLNRTEYARAVRSMLGLSVDVTTLLPKDVSSDGFDDIAAVLRVSPAFLDQYISAARNVARQAVGRAGAKPTSREYRIPSNLDQSEHIDGLPLGTRGGAVVTHWFPADGEYEFNIRNFFFSGAGYVTKIDSPHRVILTIDDVPVFHADVGGPEDQKAVDTRFAAASDELQARFNHIRVRLPAGSHRVGVAFVQRSFAESDSPLQPIAELPEMERYPTIPGLDIAGPFNVTGVGDTVSRQRIFICRPHSEAEEPPCARRILRNLATQAFRRPVTDADLEAPLAFYREGRAAGDFDAGIESGLTAILSSTRFLFRAEPRLAAVPQPSAAAATDSSGIYRIDDLALASRLSFFLWSEGPDAALLELATTGRLHQPEVLHAEVSRMLADPRAASLVSNFAFQWLAISKMDNVEPTPSLYPDFDRNLREGYRQEMRLFLDSILRSNRSVLELLTSDRTFLNERVAREYGVPDIRGDQFRPVLLKDPRRFGLLGKGAILMGTAYGNRTSPVLRGSWILENITGTPPDSPPPGVPQLVETEPGTQAQTVRVRLEHHRANPSCNACHGVIDPLGFALENFDVVGAWRDRDLDAGTAIDAGGRLADGTDVSGPVQLRAALLKHPDLFVQTLTEKLMTFALGRALTAPDMPAVRAIVREADAHGDTFESIAQGIVASAAFQMRQPGAAPAGQQVAANGP